MFLHWSQSDPISSVLLAALSRPATILAAVLWLYPVGFALTCLWLDMLSTVLRTFWLGPQDTERPSHWKGSQQDNKSITSESQWSLLLSSVTLLYQLPHNCGPSLILVEEVLYRFLAWNLLYWCVTARHFHIATVASQLEVCQPNSIGRKL